MYERFTDRARKVMFLANREAQRLKHEDIGTEHILLGLLKEGSGVAAHVLHGHALDVEVIAQTIERLNQPGTVRADSPRTPSPKVIYWLQRLRDVLCWRISGVRPRRSLLPKTPRAKKVIEYATEEAWNLKHEYIGTEHILLGLLRDKESVAAAVLATFGLKVDELREEIMRFLGPRHV
jgi:ATP-dependent Clp protease ATP-binding subunit ClpC